jgi:hypothetical protein
MSFFPGFAHSRALRNPLTGANTSGPATPIPQCFPNGRRGFHL